jgi:hypothetical protein
MRARYGACDPRRASVKVRPGPVEESPERDRGANNPRSRFSFSPMTTTQRRKARNPSRRHPGSPEHTGPRWFAWRRIEAERRDLPHGCVHPWRYAYGDADKGLADLRADMTRYTPADTLEVEFVTPPLDWLKTELIRARDAVDKASSYQVEVWTAIVVTQAKVG